MPHRPCPRDRDPDTAAAFARLKRLEPGGREHEQVRREIIEAWLPMAERISRRFHNRGEATADLRQVAALALVRAVDAYDPDLGHAFPSYAVPAITGGLRRHFRDFVGAVRIPRHLQQASALLKRTRAALEQELQAVPTAAELAAATGLSERDVHEGLRVEHVQRAWVLDAPTGDADIRLLDVLGDTDAALDVVLDRETARALIARLPERERYVLYLRYFEDLTQADIGAVLGISQMQVSRILKRALGRLRQSSDEADPV
ncbi:MULTISPECIES: sigma-70 family RNA polymerase sigma factor [Streptomyces]|uniref:Sigma-70 family RNA polymerase sigma factor n=1 Tax=Streptomyces morookaense TaxID=1970 RepID=A0A7Y7AZY2_STRMO|nr:MULTISPECIES: sigma-70 family RNA polymerase sigma factor [Streptomyces]MCC2274451.1 sigma-70 family RNA polymerase sigma factor [Streptomyces sp. ET3-23]NVK76474.1 sigma-70 family RNA polymerase sigma factor [Streptomyces morookaense]GHF07360.1 RNA polymerase sigma factor [Streptomyces morookaense]